MGQFFAVKISSRAWDAFVEDVLVWKYPKESPRDKNKKHNSDHEKWWFGTKRHFLNGRNPAPLEIYEGINENGRSSISTGFIFGINSMGYGTTWLTLTNHMDNQTRRLSWVGESVVYLSHPKSWAMKKGLPGGLGYIPSHVSHEKNLGWLDYIGDYTTYLYGDYNKPL